MHKKLVVLLSVLVLALGGCARVSGDQGGGPARPTIGFTVYNMTSYITLGREGVRAEAAALGANVLWRSANGDVSTQVAHMQSFINQGVDAIIVAPVNASTLRPQIEAAKAAGIPVFATNLTFNKPMSEMTEAYVGADDVAAGKQAMRVIAEALGGHGNIVLLQGPLGSSGEIDRTKGVLKVLAKYPGINLLAKQSANWARNEAYNLMNNWLSAFGGRIDAVVSENDDMAIGALRALASRGLAGELPVVGVDGIQDGLERVMSGKMIATNLQNAPLQLGMALAVAIKHIRGEPYPEEALMDMPLVTKQNVRKVYDRLYTNRGAYLDTLPKLIETNLASGDYGRQSLSEPIERGKP